jgi:endonuclease/exonuclease/phosphatase family protein
MAVLHVAFWNVKSLCAPASAIKGGPQTGAELTAKIATIADTLRNLFDKAGPDLIGLAEVYTGRILNSLCAQLGARYHTLWEPCKNTLSPLSGLAVLARADRFAALSRIDAYAPTLLSRPRYLIAKCKLADHDDPIFFVVNHWRSKFSNEGNAGASDRLETARALGDWPANQPRDTCAVVLGDFNAEPL